MGVDHRDSEREYWVNYSAELENRKIVDEKKLLEALNAIDKALNTSRKIKAYRENNPPPPLESTRMLSKIHHLKAEIETYFIFLAIMLGSLVLTIASIFFAEITPVPFLIFLSVYLILSIYITNTTTPIGKFMSYSLPSGSGGVGCIMAPLYLIARPIVGFISCAIGLFVLIYKITKNYEEMAEEKNKLNDLQEFSDWETE